MNCPNCTATFTLRFDYARHLQRCRPRDATMANRELLLRKLNAAATVLAAEFPAIEAATQSRRRRVA